MWPRRNNSSASSPAAGPAATLVQPLRRPLMGALAVWIPATLMGLALPGHPLPPLILAALCSLFAWRRQASTLLWIAWALVAYAHAALTMHPPSPRELAALMDRPREQMVVEGQVRDDPYLEADTQTPVWRMTLQISRIQRIDQWEKARGRMTIWWHEPPEGQVPQYGDRYRFSGVAQQRERSDWRWAFLDPYRMRVAGSEGQVLERGQGSPLQRLAFAGRRLAAQRLGAGLEDYPQVAGILRALLLGYRQELPTDHHRLFAQTGTLHIFAISGLHVGIVGALLILIVRAFGVSRPHWILYVGPLLILYTIATGMRPSAVRACIMALVFGSAFLSNRRPDAPSAWALSALLILVFDPTQLTSPGFIFSFVIVAGLIRLYPLFAGATRSWWTPEAYDLDAEGKAHTWRIQTWRWLAGLAAASLAAWLASTPLTAHYFNLFSPIGLLANLLVIPAAFLIVLSGFLSLLLGTLLPLFAEIFNHTNRVIVTALIAIIDRLATVPGGHRYVPSPGPFWMALWYSMLFGGLLVKRRHWRIRAGITLAALAAMVAVGQFVQQPVRLSVIAVGDGHAVLVQAGGRAHLFDAGPAYRADHLLRWLRSAGVNRLDTLILSNPSAPHIGGAPAILRAMPVGEIWRTDYPSRSDTYAAIWTHAGESAIPVRTRQTGDAEVWPGALAWEILHPGPVQGFRRAADAAMVMRLSLGGKSVLLMGAAGGRTEQFILNQPIDPAASVVVIGNQGRDQVASVDWLHAVRPEAVVLSVGAYNRGGYPERPVLERLKDIPVWRTDEQGTIQITLSSKSRGGRRQDTLKVQGAWNSPP